MWELDYKESWLPKNWCFEPWCWRRLLRVPWTARRSNQSILKEISPEYSLEGLLLKLKLQYFGHLMWRNDSFEKTLVLGKIEGGRRSWGPRMRWLDGITDSMDMSLSEKVESRNWWWTGKPGMLQSMGLQSQTRLSNWIEVLDQGPSLLGSSWGSSDVQIASFLLEPGWREKSLVSILLKRTLIPSCGLHPHDLILT